MDLGSGGDRKGEETRSHSQIIDRSVTLVGFLDEICLEEFTRLKQGKFEDRRLASEIETVMDELKENPTSGIQIERRLWPKKYTQYGINNLWKYDMQRGWRLIYMIRGSKLEIEVTILEWFDHKGYEKRFGYRTR